MEMDKLQIFSFLSYAISGIKCDTYVLINFIQTLWSFFIPKLETPFHLRIRFKGNYTRSW